MPTGSNAESDGVPCEPGEHPDTQGTDSADVRTSYGAGKYLKTQAMTRKVTGTSVGRASTLPLCKIVELSRATKRVTNKERQTPCLLNITDVSLRQDWGTFLESHLFQYLVTLPTSTYRNHGEAMYYCFSHCHSQSPNYQQYTRNLCRKFVCGLACPSSR
jgi:hypothetical protein